MSLDKMVEQFKDMTELLAYADAQTKTILELSKKLAKAEEEVKHLKKILEDSTPLLEEQKKDFLGYSPEDPKEKIIAEVQLNMLKEISFDRELTLEETKRVEIFSKILLNLRASKANEQEVPSKTLSNDDLLKLAEELNGNAQ